MNAYSQWFFAEGWLYATGFGLCLGWTVGMKACLVIVPLVLLAVLGLAGGVA